MNPKHLRLAKNSYKKGQGPLLVLDHISHVFCVNGGYATVLENISFHAAKGEFVCILGASGCGKSTLLKILAGFLRPSSGQLFLNGKTVTRPGADRCVIFQEDALFPWLTVRENIAFGLKGKKLTRKQKRHEVERFLNLVGLGPFGDYLPEEISGGMKQRVSLARVLILQPQVLLMDEPFAALDAQAREQMQNLLLSLWERLSHTVLFVTHDVQEAAALADTIIVMNKNPGRIEKRVSVNLARPRKRENPKLVSFINGLYREIGL